MPRWRPARGGPAPSGSGAVLSVAAGTAVTTRGSDCGANTVSRPRMRRTSSIRSSSGSILRRPLGRAHARRARIELRRSGPAWCPRRHRGARTARTTVTCVAASCVLHGKAQALRGSRYGVGRRGMSACRPRCRAARSASLAFAAPDGFGSRPWNMRSLGSPPHMADDQSAWPHRAPFGQHGSGPRPRSNRARASLCICKRRPVRATRTGVEQRAFDEDVRGGRAHGGGLAAHDAGQRNHAGRIGDDDVLGS